MDPEPGLPGCYRRRLRVRNTSGRAADITGALFRLHLRRPAGAAQWTSQSFGMVESAPGGPVACAAFTTSEDRWELSTQHVGGALAVTHTSNAAWRLPPDADAVIGTQYFWAVQGNLETARKSAAAWYQAVGLRVLDLPDWIRDAVLYQASAGGTLDSRFSDVGGFDAFAAQVDYLADLGFNALWLLNPLTHKDPHQPRDGWNHYDPLRYDEVDPAYGGEAALHRLVRRLRGRWSRIHARWSRTAAAPSREKPRILRTTATARAAPALARPPIIPRRAGRR